jgi:transcriptional regulator with XRE-family HTH domain
MIKQKSLRQFAEELGVSAAYLSQVRNGRVKPSARLLNMLSESGAFLYPNLSENPRVISSTLILDTSLYSGFSPFSKVSLIWP